MADTVATVEDIEEVGSSRYLQERRYLWTARVFAVFCAVSICANIVLIIAINNIVPLVRVEPFLFTFQDRQEQVLRIENNPAVLSKNDPLTESLVRNYILVRNTIVSDVGEMMNRWGADGPIRWQSSGPVFAEFVSKSQEIISRYMKEGRTRSVALYSVARLSEDFWQAEIEMRDMVPESSAPAVSRWIVQMKVGYLKSLTVSYSQRLKNPLGFVVQQYSIKSKD